MNRPLRTAHGIRPTAQVEYRDEDLLTRNNRHIGVFVVIEVLVLGHDLVDAGGDVAIERAARLNRAEIHSIHVDISSVEALGGVPQTVEPDPGLTWRRCRNLWCGRGSTSGRRQNQQQARHVEPIAHRQNAPFHHCFLVLLPSAVRFCPFQKCLLRRDQYEPAFEASRITANAELAEGAGFEPARRFITVYTLSRRAPSTARPPLQACPHIRANANNLAKPPKACNGARAQSMSSELLALGGGKARSNA